MKFLPPSEKSGNVSGTTPMDENRKLTSPYNGDDMDHGIDCEGSNEEPYTVKVDDMVSKSSKPDEIEVDSGEAESSHSKEKTIEPSDDICINGRKRGRIKQKKLSLSICSSKDQSNPKEDQNLTNSLKIARTDKPTVRHVSLHSLEPPAEYVAPIEVQQTWKCQDLKVSQCIKQDKVVQS